MFASGTDIVRIIETWAPPRLAESDDPVGLQLGTLAKPVRKAMVALEVTPGVADEAAHAGADLIVVHHPLFFRPVPHLRTDTPFGRMCETLLRREIAVYAAHTNFDAADGGMNDLMALALGLERTRPLVVSHTERLKKLVVFVPETHHGAVLDAMFASGAGWIGNYSHCSFNVEGVGTFLPGEGTSPFVGEQGKLERVREIRVETVVPEPSLERVVRAMLDAHPYEEVAYDVYPLDVKGRESGLGRVGRLAEEESLAAFAERVKRAFGVSHVRVVGDPDRPVRTVAVLGGAGRRYARQAAASGADVYVTGDVDYHTAREAEAVGLAIVDPGHWAESMMVRPFAERLGRALRDAGFATEVVASEAARDPFWWR